MAELAKTRIKKAFMLKVLTQTMGNASLAIKISGVGRRTHYNWLNSDAAYKSAVESLNLVSVNMSEEHLLKELEEHGMYYLRALYYGFANAEAYKLYQQKKIEAKVYLFKLLANKFQQNSIHEF